MLKILQILLLPLSLVYGFIMALRNLAFRLGILNSFRPNIPSITVGNLSVGGTGKTPMIEYLLDLNLGNNPAVVSRGYGRKTKGLLKVESSGTAEEFGDESLQMAQKYPEAQFWVSEKRAVGAKQAQKAGSDLILFDDAYQHRYIQSDFQILLSAYDSMFFKDFVLPAGRLREFRAGAKRAQCIVITKCPHALSEMEQASIRNSIRHYSKAQVFFAGLSYQIPQNAKGQDLKDSEIEVITAIAKPEPLLTQLQQKYTISETWLFRDHHLFSTEDLESIWERKTEENRTWVCSEKDYVKLAPLFIAADRIDQLFYIAVKHRFLGNDAKDFQSLIKSHFSKALD